LNKSKWKINEIDTKQPDEITDLPMDYLKKKIRRPKFLRI